MTMTTAISATRRVPASDRAVFAFLADLENHWRLSPRFQVLELDRNRAGAAIGGIVRVHGPLGLRRTVRTRVAHVDPPVGMRGEAIVDDTRAQVEWTMTADGDGTIVRLSVDVIRESWQERLLFALGGRRWLRLQFDQILDELDRLVSSP